MAEVKVKPKGALARRSGFEMPLFREHLFNMNPFALMRRFTEEVDRVFGAATGSMEEPGVWAPAVEVKEVNGKLLVSAELPGLKKDEIKVQVTPEALILEGERKREKEERKEGYYHSERSYGRFHRTIPLPEEVDVDQVLAEFSNGVLEVSIPVTETKHKPREIPVSEGGKVKAAGG